MPTRTSYAIRHLLERLESIDVLLDAAAAKRAKIGEDLVGAGAAQDVITRDHVTFVLEHIRHLDQHLGMSARATVNPRRESALRDAAHGERISLPLDDLAEALELSEFECEALVLCAATEVDSSFGTAFAYIQDDITA